MTLSSLESDATVAKWFPAGGGLSKRCVYRCGPSQGESPASPAGPWASLCWTPELSRPFTHPTRLAVRPYFNYFNSSPSFTFASSALIAFTFASLAFGSGLTNGMFLPSSSDLNGNTWSLEVNVWYQWPRGSQRGAL